MASPQCEHGFTRIANELLDAFLSAGRRLTKREALLWLAILRLTYGFNKKADFIPVRRLEKMTGIRFDHVHETVWRLKKRGLIHLEKREGRLFLGINKDYSLWFVPGRPETRAGASRKGRGTVQRANAHAPKGHVPKTGNSKADVLLPEMGTGKLPEPGNGPVTQAGNIKRQNTYIKKSSSSEGRGDKNEKKGAPVAREEDDVFLRWRKIFGTRLPERLREKAGLLLSEIRAGRIEPSRIRLPLRYLDAFEPPRDIGSAPLVPLSAGMKVSYKGRTFEISDGLCIFMEDGLMVEGTIRRLIQLGQMKVIGEKGDVR